MKQYDEFTVSQASIVGIQKLLAKEIIEALQPLMVGAQMFVPDFSLVGTAGKSKLFRKQTGITGMANFNEGAQVPDVVSATQDVDVDIEPINFGGKETIYADAMQYADYNVINNVKMLLAQAMAQEKDTRYWKAICGATAITNEAVGTGDGTALWFQLDHGYDVATDEAILEMGAVTVGGVAKVLGTDYSVDFYNGWIWFAVAPASLQAIVASYNYADGRQVLDATTITDASYADLIAAKSKIVSAYGKPDTAVLNQNQVSDLLVDDKFLAAAASGAGEKVILNGQISRAAGLDVLESQKMYEGVIAVLKKKDIGFDCYKEKLSTEIEKIAGTKGDVWAKLWEKSAADVSRPTLIALVFNCHRYAKNKT